MRSGRAGARSFRLREQRMFEPSELRLRRGRGKRSVVPALHHADRRLFIPALAEIAALENLAIGNPAA
jgi:hypothetical protein